MFSHYVMLVFPALVILLQSEFGVGMSEIFSLSFLGYLLYGLGALPAGYLTDRFGGRFTLQLCLLGCSVGAFGAAYSRSIGELSLALAVIGLASSLYHPAGMTIITRNVRESGSALGTNGIFGNLGIAIAPFTTGALASWRDWRMAYFVPAVILFVGFLLLSMIKPQDKLDDAQSAVSEQAQEALPIPIWIMLFYAAALACAGLAYRSTSISLPAFFETRSDYLLPFLSQIEQFLPLSSNKTLAATFITSAAYFVGMIGQAFGGRVADRYDLRLSYAIFHLLSLPFLGLFFLLPISCFPFAAGGYIFFAMGMQPIENSIVARLSIPKWHGVFYGLKFTLTFGVGSLAVYAVAFIKSHHTLPLVFLFTAIVTAGTLLFALLFWLFSGAHGDRFRKVTGTVRDDLESKKQSA
jgi:MFS transporter, FSR family, fosmidomycin resistance protein